MADLELHWTRHAQRDVDGLTPDVRDGVLSDLWTLPAAPYPSGVRIKKLKGFVPPLYRLRSGDFRVLYRIEGETVLVMRVIDRALLDRVLRSLT